MANPIFSTKCDFTFIWKIQNINCLWLKQHEKLDSPEFAVNKLQYTCWNLRLYPRGYSSANDIGFFLYRCPLTYEYCLSPAYDVYFELAFLSENGSILCSRQSNKCKFYEHSSEGFDLFVSRENVFVQNKSAYLPLNTLTARCKIWRCDEKFEVSQSVFAHTRVLVHQIPFQWPIGNFGTLKCNENKSLQISSSINPGNVTKTLKFDLYLASKQSSEEIIFIAVDVSNMDAKYLAFKTFLVDTYGNFKDVGSKEFFLNDIQKKGTHTLLLSKDQIINGSYLKNDVLTLHCECIYSTGMFSDLINLGIASYTVTPLVQNEDGLPTDGSENVGGFPSDDTVSLREDLLYLHNHDVLSDMKLRTATKMIPVHTQILVARSPVFRAMFTNDMKEKIEGCIDVPDLDDDTVRRMLLYMYTDKVEDLQWEEASQLYEAADKYDILSLRRKCGAILQAKLSPTNACRILTLADMYKDEVMKKAVQDYIVMQGKTLFSCAEWKLLMNTDVQLAAEIMFQYCNKD